MKTDYKTKDLKAQTKKPAKKSQWNFPRYGITVEATNLEEAQKLLKKELKNA